MRRSVAAAVAMLVVALSLCVALVATKAPLDAANTASEGALASDGTRTLAADTRYGTAIRLARNALDSGIVRADEVIIASGESLVDSLAAVSLARARNAAVLLTPTIELTTAVERFIDEAGFVKVTLMGGTNAVSADVEFELARSGLFDSIDRIWGDDRYETAVVAAAAGGDVGRYCDRGEPAAFLVNGEGSASQPLIDGVVVAPLAYATAMPILLTRRDELPASVAAYIAEASIGRVVVVGSDDTIDPSVVDELAAVGTAVTRIDGDSPAARSVALVEAVASCSDAPHIASNRYALLSADVPVDGITAAAALAGGLGDDDGVVLMLAVGSSQAARPTSDPASAGLPAVVADHLAQTPTAVGSVPTHVTLYALGGTSRIAPEVMSAALDAAVTSAPLAATITAPAGSNTIRISFSDEVDVASALDPSIYDVAGTTLLPTDRVAWDRSSRSVVISLDVGGDFQLASGDEITIAPDRIRGSQTSGQVDLRTVAATTYVVPESRPDNERPRLSVVAAPGASTLRVFVDEANPGVRRADGLEASEITLTLSGEFGSGDFGATSSSMLETVQVGAPTPTARGVGVVATRTHYDVYWGCATAAPASGAECTGEVDGNLYRLNGGDRVLITPGAVVDQGGRASRSVVERVSRTVREPALAEQPERSGPVVALDADGSQRNASATLRAGGRDIVTITARADGVAGGSAGNSWDLSVAYRPDTASAGAPVGAPADDEPDVSVSLVTSRRTVSLVYDEDASVADIVTELQDALDLPGAFSVSQLARSQADYTQPLATAPDAATFQLTGGASEATLTLRFGDPLAAFNLDAFVAAQPPNSPFARSVTTTVTAATHADATSTVPSVAIAQISQIAQASQPAAFPAQVVVLTYLYEGQPLPSTADTMNFPAGVALDYRGQTNAARRSLRVSSAAQRTPEPGT